MLRLVLWSFLVGFVFINPRVATGQEYPGRPIRILTSEPGGGQDFASRIIAQGLSAAMGQPVIVDNRGAGGTISGEIVARAAPDGYNLLVAGSTFWIGPLLRKSSYDPIKEFAPVSLLADYPNILVVHPSLSVKSVKELIDLAKTKPGVLNYASTGPGGTIHLSAELFKTMAGVDIVHVPFKGSGAAMINLIGGQVQLMFVTSSSVAPHLQSGKLRALAVTSLKSSALVPNLPTVAATVPGYETGGATAMFAPLRIPATIVNRLNREVARLLDQADIKEKFFNAGVQTIGSSPQQLALMLKAETAKWDRLIKDAGIRAE